jgi:hypothetical protein
MACRIRLNWNTTHKAPDRGFARFGRLADPSIAHPSSSGGRVALIVQM